MHNSHHRFYSTTENINRSTATAKQKMSSPIAYHVQRIAESSAAQQVSAARLRRLVRGAVKSEREFLSHQAAATATATGDAGGAL
jgi:hypothetical protein